uniref:EF-hand domain-containing protein n=1 Tax=Prymnesium polylepis TaxID=72548 RepID=A0A6V4TDN4_9EUKA
MAATIADIQTKFLNKLEAKLPGGKAVTPMLLKKALNHFDGDGDGVISLAEFLRCSDGKIEDREAEFLFMFWDSAAGQQEPCGMVEIDMAVHDLLSSQPQYSTLLQGKDLANIAGQSKGNRPSQEGGIFGGGCYASESEREILAARNRPALSNPTVAPPAMPATFSKPVNNASSIQGGIFGAEGGGASPPKPNRSNRSNQSSVEGGIFGATDGVRAPPSRNGRNPNASSIEGGIFG